MILDIVILVFTALVLIFSTRLFRVENKFMNIVNVLMLLVVFATITLNLVGNKNYDAIRTLLMFITAIIALFALWNTTRISNITINNTEYNQKTNLIVGLLNNHYKIVEDKKNEIDKLWEKLFLIFQGNQYEYNEIHKILCKNLYKDDTFIRKVGMVNEEIKNPNNANIFLKSLKIIGENDGTAKDIDYERLTYMCLSVTELENTKVLYEELKDNDGLKFASVNISEKILEAVKKHLKPIVEDYIKRNNEIFQKYTTKNKEYFKEFTFRRKLVNTIFNEHYKDTGHIFRNSYRIVKIINQEFKDDESKRKQYLGLLRSYYTDEFLLILFYNSVYTDKGLGFTKLLVGTDFFGTKNELETTSFITHIDLSKILFSEDKDALIKLFTKDEYSNFSQKKEISDELDIDDLKKMVDDLYK